MSSRLHHSIRTTLSLGVAEVQRISALLQAHLDHAEAIYTALIDESGTSLAEMQSAPLAGKVEICTLANSALGAVREMARRLDEGSPGHFFHQGSRVSFAVAEVTPAASLLTVYGPQGRLGIVRAALAGTLPKLQNELETISRQADLNSDGFPIFDGAELFAASPYIPGNATPGTNPVLFEPEAPVMSLEEFMASLEDLSHMGREANANGESETATLTAGASAIPAIAAGSVMAVPSGSSEPMQLFREALQE